MGALGDVVRGVADAECVRSAWTGVRVDGASDGYGAGLEPGSDGGGASGAATEADMTKVVSCRYRTTAEVSCADVDGKQRLQHHVGSACRLRDRRVRDR